eukprot:COSAG01_NODE_4335_length_5127_cov_4.593278_6_plen_142_part_00
MRLRLDWLSPRLRLVPCPTKMEPTPDAGSTIAMPPAPTSSELVGTPAVSTSSTSAGNPAVSGVLPSLLPSQSPPTHAGTSPADALPRGTEGWRCGTQPLELQARGGSQWPGIPVATGSGAVAAGSSSGSGSSSMQSIVVRR